MAETIANWRWRQVMEAHSSAPITELLLHISALVDKDQTVQIKMEDEDRDLYKIDGGHDFQRMLEDVKAIRLKRGLEPVMME